MRIERRLVISQLPIMDHKLICQWLGLPAAVWPPDHYTLLGLQPGEGDGARIEQHVQERLARLRCYQLSHPEQATEAMNCLAKAFVCLTDARAKQGYDLSLGLSGNGRGSSTTAAAGLAVRETVPRPEPRLSDSSSPGRKALASAPPINGNHAVAAVAPPAPTAAAEQVQIEWSSAPPPPVRAPVLPEAPPPAAAAPAAETPPPAPPAAPEPASPEPPVSRPADPIIERARASWAARRGLGTRRALHDRLLTTRHLLRLWDQAGRYLSRPKRSLVRFAEATDLSKRLTALDDNLVDFPPILGQPGQPGYRVVMLARDEDIPATFRKLDPLEREALALDWKVGRTVLQSHLNFVRQEVRDLRRHRAMAFLRPISFALDEYFFWLLLGLIVLTLLAASYSFLL